MKDLGKVTVYKARNSTWVYVDGVKAHKIFFGLITTRSATKAGWKDLLNIVGDETYDLKDVLERDSDLYVDGKRIMQKPYVILTFLHMDRVVKHFDTIEEASAFAKKLVGDNVYFEKI